MGHRLKIHVKCMWSVFQVQDGLMGSACEVQDGSHTEKTCDMHVKCRRRDPPCEQSAPVFPSGHWQTPLTHGALFWQAGTQGTEKAKWIYSQYWYSIESLQPTPNRQISLEAKESCNVRCSAVTIPFVCSQTYCHWQCILLYLYISQQIGHTQANTQNTPYYLYTSYTLFHILKN